MTADYEHACVTSNFNGLVLLFCDRIDPNDLDHHRAQTHLNFLRVGQASMIERETIDKLLQQL